jgi:hypothetical protein
MPHGGGLDDLVFVGGTTYVALSNPTLNASGVNVFPALAKLTVTGSSATMTPVLMGNAPATDSVAKAPTTLNLTDPDSLTTDLNGNIVLVSQADSALITIQHPGASNQTVIKTPVGNQEDDTVFATAPAERMLVADAGKNIVFSIAWSGSAGTVLTEAPNDSGVVGFGGTIDLSTGFITPVVVGMVKTNGADLHPEHGTRSLTPTPEALSLGISAPIPRGLPRRRRPGSSGRCYPQGDSSSPRQPTHFYDDWEVVPSVELRHPRPCDELAGRHGVDDHFG